MTEQQASPKKIDRFITTSFFLYCMQTIYPSRDTLKKFITVIAMKRSAILLNLFMDAIVNYIQNPLPQAGVPQSLEICSIILKVTAAAATVFLFLSSSPILFALSVASIGLDVFALQNSEWFEEVDAFIAQVLGQFAPVPVRNPAINWAQVQTLQGTIVLSSRDSAFVGTDSRELYQHIKTENGMPLVQSEDAFYYAARPLPVGNLADVEAALKLTNGMPDSLPSDLLAGLQPGDRLKFLWKDQILFDLEVEDWALEAFHKAQKQDHKYLTDEDIPSDHIRWFKRDGFYVHLSPEAQQIVPGGVGTQPCDFSQLPVITNRNIETLQLRNKNDDSGILRLIFAVCGCSAENIGASLCMILDKNNLYIYFKRPIEELSDLVTVLVDTLPKERFCSLDLEPYLTFSKQSLQTDQIQLVGPQAGLIMLSMPLQPADSAV
jgi:hypothetical protein